MFECGSNLIHEVGMERHSTAINGFRKHSFLLQLGDELGNRVSWSGDSDCVRCVMTRRYNIFRTAVMCLLPRQSYIDIIWLNFRSHHFMITFTAIKNHNKKVIRS